MLTELRVENFKAFRDAVTVPLKPLTILLGRNSSGKTALARLPLALLAGLEQRGTSTQPLPLTARGLVMGASSTDLVHARQTHGSFSLGLTAIRAGSPVDIDVKLQLAQTLTRRELPFISRFRVRPLIDEVHWVPQTSSGSRSYSDPSIESFAGLLPQYRDPGMQATTSGLRSFFAESFANLMHLASIRTPLEAVYEKREVGDIHRATGAEAPHLLDSNQALLEAVVAWYWKNLRVRLALETGVDSFGLWVAAGAASANLSRAGQGYQQVLPVVTYLCGLLEGLLPLQTLVVEEPELHLHPAVHGALADLSVSAVTASGPRRQVVIETHSENFVLRVRRHVAAGNLDPSQVNIIWLEDQIDGMPIREILIRKDGSVTAWPAGVFSEDLDEVRAIAQAVAH